MATLKFSGEAVTAIEELGSLIDSFKSVLLLRSAVKMELFDTIQSYGTAGVSAAQLNKDKQMNRDKIERVMNALVAVNALTKDNNKHGVSVYHNTHMGKLLTANGGFQSFVNSCLDDASGFDQIAADVGGNPAAASQHEKKPDDKEKAEDKPESTEDASERTYKGCMLFDSWGKTYAKQLIPVMELSGCTSLVDLGGGSGVFSFEAARQHNKLTVTLMEMDEVVECVKKHFLPKEENLHVNMIAGDFMKGDIPAADVYLLSNVVHFWSDEVFIELVNKISKVAKSGSRIILIEKCLNADKTGPVSASMWDMFMLLYPPCIGRSHVEYEAILTRTHYNTVHAKLSNPECIYDVIIATKA